MNSREKGFLLLTSHLGDPERKPLTAAQLRTLAGRMRTMEVPKEERAVAAEDLVAIGYDRAEARRILELLGGGEQLQWYLSRGRKRDCVPLSRVSAGYPAILRRRLGQDAPGCLWAKGDLSLLELPAIALVGSRELRQENMEFASRAGFEAARQGYVLVSGNARGADQTAQQAALEAGGKVISVVADSLERHPLRKNILYLAEDSYDLAFSSLRALRRNRIIHCLGRSVLVAQSALGKGGTWDGTAKNLQQGWSPVFCFNDGSAGIRELCQMGAQSIYTEELADIPALQENTMNFIDQ